MAIRPQISDKLSKRVRGVTRSEFSVPDERVAFGDRLEVLLDHRLQRRERIEELEQEVRELERHVDAETGIFGGDR